MQKHSCGVRIILRTSRRQLIRSTMTDSLKITHNHFLASGIQPSSQVEYRKHHVEQENIAYQPEEQDLSWWLR